MRLSKILHISDKNDKKMKRKNYLCRIQIICAMEKYKYTISEDGTCFISNGVTTIEDRTFRNCTSLKCVAIPSSVKEIGISAFAKCTSLKRVVIPGSVREIGMSAFAECTALESVVIHNGVSEISVGAFNGCSSLKSVVIPGSVRNICLAAFHRCISLKSVDIQNGVRVIDGAFLNCTSLESVIIPPSVRMINNTTFDGCPALKTVHFRIKNLDDIDIRHGAFSCITKSKCTLYVPAYCLQACRQHEELGQFKNIEIEKNDSIFDLF